MSKHQIQPGAWRMSRLMRDETAKTVSRDQILRLEQGQRSVYFSCSADLEQNWQPCPGSIPTLLKVLTILTESATLPILFVIIKIFPSHRLICLRFFCRHASSALQRQVNLCRVPQSFTPPTASRKVFEERKKKRPDRDSNS